MNSTRWEELASLRDSRLREDAAMLLWGYVRRGWAKRAIRSRLEPIKRGACGYRNRQRFHNAIYFHLGGLDLYPDSLNSIHTKA